MRCRTVGSQDTTNKRSAFGRAARMIAGCAAAGAVLAGPTAALATPTQGALAATSTGIINISATVLSRAQISGLVDIAFPTADPIAGASTTQNDCVWSNTATKGYTIKATGSGTGSAFTLVNGANTIPYTVGWAGSSGASTSTGLTANTTSTGFTSTATQPTCQTGATSTSTLFVAIAATDVQTMVANVAYTGTLTLLVTPQ